MENANQSFVGYFKYEGALVADGYFDARKSAEALIGIDEVLRYFLYQESPDLQKIEFEIPIKVREGSWEALIPHSLSDWLITAVGAGATTYLTTALTKAAEKDFKDKGLKDLVKEAFKAIKWVLKIASHMKSMAVKQFTKAEFKQNESGEDIVGISNEYDMIIFVPKKYLEVYTKCPEKLFSRLAKLIQEGRQLEVGLNPNVPVDNDDLKGNVRISVEEKYFFTKKEDEELIIFPEMKHGDYVELEGHVTRGNENTNTIGFDYLNHILVCTPSNGTIKTYKNLLFTNCIIKGYVDRTDDEGNEIEKKPKIRFIDLIDISKPTTQLGLFMH